VVFGIYIFRRIGFLLLACALCWRELYFFVNCILGLVVSPEEGNSLLPKRSVLSIL